MGLMGLGGIALPVNFPSDALVGLASLLLTYIMKGNGGPMQYAKGIAPIMGRTDFGSMFQTDIPPAEQLFLSTVIGGHSRLTDMFNDILPVAGIANGVNAQLFTNNPTVPAGQGIAIAGQLSRETWLDNITLGVDQLTAANFPNALAQPHMFGLGARGGHHEGTGGGAAPVFELRRMQQHITPHHFTEIAMGIFDYLVALNSAAGPGAGPYAHPNRAVKNLQAAQLNAFQQSEALIGG
jgi:hypothetical protein